MFRLVEAGVSGGGPLTLSGVYPSIWDATTAAERMLEQLQDRPHRRPWAYRVVDVETGEIVTTVRAPSEYDPDPFADPPVAWLPGGTADPEADNTPVTPGPGVVPPPGRDR